MPDQSYFKQVDEKHVSAEVRHMVWSPKMDLISLANEQGEVILYRLSWQRVWTLPAPSEGVTVSALAWRPDGKVVAVGYMTGKLALCDVENSEILHSAEIQGQITHMSWISQSLPEGETWSSKPYPEDNSEVFLPKLQPVSKSYGTLTKEQSEECAEDSKHLKSQTLLNLLVIGSDTDLVHLYAYGVCPLAYIQLGIQTGTKPSRVISAAVSQDLLTLSLIAEVQDEGAGKSDFFLFSYDMALVASRHKEVRLLALKYGQVYSLISYMKSTIQQMSEAWEDILMEMDSKLLKFAEEKRTLGTGTVSTDFLELLLFGTPSPELQAFLLHGLTEKGLKKLGHSIESSYSNIQKLVVKHLQNVSQSLLYHLSDLRGLSLWYDKFGILGLNTNLLQDAISASGSFVLKTSELQQVIDGSIKKFKAFFRWLYVVIMRLSGEQFSPDLSKITQYDMNFVAEFLKDNFAQFSEDEGEEDKDILDKMTTSTSDEADVKEPRYKDVLDKISRSTSDEADVKKPRFKLEKVGQYLKNENLHYPADNTGNPWSQFVKFSTHLKESPLLYPVETDKSLIQLQETLESAIDSALNHPASVIGKFLLCSKKFHLSSSLRSDEQKSTLTSTISQFTINEFHHLYSVFTFDPKPSQTFYVLRHPTDSKKEDYVAEAVCLSVGRLCQPETDPESSLDQRSECSKHKILDLAFYDEKTLSLLLVQDTEESLPVLAQLSLAVLQDDMFQPISQSDACVTALSQMQPVDLGPLIEPVSWKVLENMKALSFAVSGTRKVACVLFSSRRRVRLFLMDTEEEEEEEGEESQLESESSHHGDSRQEDSAADQSADPEENIDENKENTSTNESQTSNT